MRLILMRHGYCKGIKEGIINGWRDFPLTAKGRKEPIETAEAVKKLLGDVKLDKAYSSYVSRTYDTAVIFSDALNYKGKIKQDLRLNERHYGMFQGMNKHDAKSFSEYNTLSDKRIDVNNRLVPENDLRYHTTLNEYSQKLGLTIKKLENIIPRSESILDVEKRLEEFFNEILIPENKEKTILVVTHANPLKLIVKKLEKLTYKKVSELRFATSALKIYDMRYDEQQQDYEIVAEYNINKEWEG